MAVLRQAHGELTVPTQGKGLYLFTEEAARWLQQERAQDGLLTVFIQHTSASILVQENGDPEVRADLERFFSRLVPDGDKLFLHVAEGPDDMPSHVRSALTQSSLSIPVQRGAMTLGTWQGLYLFEHRKAPKQRHLVLHYLGS
jgi:secondary thiamine-phosphate synthase enzyme